MNDVTDNCGTGAGVTVTEKPHIAAWPVVSAAKQFTVVDPTAKLAPDFGEHVVVTDPDPPVVVGFVNVTVAALLPTAARADALAGHMMLKATVGAV